MPAGRRRAEQAQGFGEWIPFCSCGGLLLLRLEGKDSAEDGIAMCDLRDPTHGVCHGVTCLNIYPSFVCVCNGVTGFFCYHRGRSKMCVFMCFFAHIMRMRHSSGFYHLLLISGGV